jgi:uncharacterized protein YecA (UPF0149 family)
LSGKAPRQAKRTTNKDDSGVEVYEVWNEPQDSSQAAYANIFDKANQKVRPNDPCPCGSGKKYKKCCGAHIA